MGLLVGEVVAGLVEEAAVGAGREGNREVEAVLPVRGRQHSDAPVVVVVQETCAHSNEIQVKTNSPTASR